MSKKSQNEKLAAQALMPHYQIPRRFLAEFWIPRISCVECNLRRNLIRKCLLLYRIRDRIENIRF